ncbi:MAG: HDOD domain-containing protein [Opitutales bacterium]|nr:HDOD domain-containing protein [Opitutales bacterium]
MKNDDSKKNRPGVEITSKPLSDFLLIERINQCPKLASLKSINETLIELLDSEDSFVSQIAEVIRLDPSLTTRVLDLVNSIFFGSKEGQRISGVEEASIFLGLNRIKELLAATPVIEEIAELGKNASSFPWINFWKHSIGTAIMTREILSLAEKKYDDESDYVAGLLHNLGKLILAITFPDLFQRLCAQSFQNTDHAIKIEKKIIGWDHAKIGAYYLWNHHISDEVVEAVHWHNNPKESKDHSDLASAIQIADLLTCQLGVPGIENCPPAKNSYLKSDGWTILFGKKEENEMNDLTQKLEYTLERVSRTLHGII